MPFILIYVTNSDLKDAKKLASHLLKKHLIACANFFPITSTYWWKGELKDANEVVSLLKTRKGNWKKVKSEVERIHPYGVPCIMKLEVEANESYEDWIKKESKTNELGRSLSQQPLQF